MDKSESGITKEIISSYGDSSSNAFCAYGWPFYVFFSSFR
jgi:hypothetical protein